RRLMLECLHGFLLLLRLVYKSEPGQSIIVYRIGLHPTFYNLSNLSNAFVALLDLRFELRVRIVSRHQGLTVVRLPDQGLQDILPKYPIRIEISGIKRVENMMAQFTGFLEGGFVSLF